MISQGTESPCLAGATGGSGDTEDVEVDRADGRAGRWPARVMVASARADTTSDGALVFPGLRLRSRDDGGEIRVVEACAIGLPYLGFSASRDLHLLLLALGLFPLTLLEGWSGSVHANSIRVGPRCLKSAVASKNETGDGRLAPAPRFAKNVRWSSTSAIRAAGRRRRPRGRCRRRRIRRRPSAQCADAPRSPSGCGHRRPCRADR